MDIFKEIRQFLYYNPLSSRDDIAKGTAFNSSEATLKCTIAALVDNGSVVVEGKVRATIYEQNNLYAF